LSYAGRNCSSNLVDENCTFALAEKKRRLGLVPGPREAVVATLQVADAVTRATQVQPEDPFPSMSPRPSGRQAVRS
jgi:hypothetical protein